MLTDAYNLFLSHRAAWNIANIFWYHWRDPKHSQASCTFCSSAALLNFNRTKKPAYTAFKNFAADITAPKATITAGPAGGSTVHDSTPTFSFKSSQAGSTFQCRFDSRPLLACPSPYTAKPALANGAHKFTVRAVDAAGNREPVRLAIVYSRPLSVRDGRESPVNAQGNTIVTRRGRRVAIALALLATSLLFASSRGAATLRSEFYGIVQTATLDHRTSSGMQAAGVHANRFILNWVWVEPTKNHFDWGSSDRFIGELASRGIRAVPSIWGNPDWVAGGAATPPTGGTTSQQQWRNLLKALVTRYGPRWPTGQGQVPPAVRRHRRRRCRSPPGRSGTSRT